MSFAFDFSASLIDVAPVSPMIFSVDIQSFPKYFLGFCIKILRAGMQKF